LRPCVPQFAALGRTRALCDAAIVMGAILEGLSGGNG
jgi:hypothetical protein